MLKNSRPHPWRPLLNNPSACWHCWDQLRSLPDLNRKFKRAPHCSVIRTMHLPTRPWKPQHSYRSPSTLLAGLSPLWSHFDSQIENETEGITSWKCPSSKGNCKQHSTALRKRASMVLLKHGTNDGNAIYVGDYFEEDGSQNWVH
jgi:hypothetical protein